MLKQRIVTAIIGVAGIIAVLVWGNPLAWQAVVWVCVVLAVLEIAQMYQFAYADPYSIYTLLLATGVVWWPNWHQPICLYIALAITLLWPVATKNRVSLQRAAALLVGALYIGVGGASLVQLQRLPNGGTWVWLCLIAIWLSDTCAFFAGRYFKGPKLWPAISPQKTVSGAVGGLVGAALGCVIFGLLLVPEVDVGGFIVTGAVISLAGQLGDLVESAYKRATGVKDSGRLLPGHGGMLDRIDSLVFAAPIAFFVIRTGLGTWFH